MRCKPVTLKLDERKSEELKPVNLVKPFDVPFHLRKAYEREIREAGILIRCETPTDWNSKVFPVIKGNGMDACLVGKFRGLNAVVQKLLWYTKSPDQLLRHIVQMPRCSE